jgi:hypothetical protein
VECDDSDPCTFDDVCSDGLCAGSARCGAPASGGAAPNVTDALFVLRASVGAELCALCVCDVNASGTVTVVDALAVLKRTVGQPVELVCTAAR